MIAVTHPGGPGGAARREELPEALAYYIFVEHGGPKGHFPSDVLLRLWRIQSRDGHGLSAGALARMMARRLLGSMSGTELIEGALADLLMDDVPLRCVEVKEGRGRPRFEWLISDPEWVELNAEFKEA